MSGPTCAGEHLQEPEEGGRLRSRREDRPRGHAGRQGAVPRQEVQGGGGQVRHAADRWPDSPLEEDALFLQGESEFFSDQYSKAHDTYGGLLKKYANTRHLDTVVAREFAIGRYWEQMYDANPTWPTTPNVTDNSRPMFDTFGYAIQAYERVRQYDPTGPLADASLMALGNAYFRHGQYEDAAYNYDTLRKEYPNSKYQMKAHLLGPSGQDARLPGHGLRRDAAEARPARSPIRRSPSSATSWATNASGWSRRRRQIIEEKANREFTLRRVLRPAQVLRRRPVVLQERDRRLSRHGKGQGGPDADGANPQRARRAAQPLRLADRDCSSTKKESSMARV